jgi:outer membrane receptor protein involved in Fe transport
LSDWDLGLFAQDGWEPFPTVRLDAGLRIDRQRLAGVTTVAPRIGVAWMPEGRTVVRGGYGRFYDRIPLNVFAFPQYPYRFDVPNLLRPEDGFAPKSETISAGIDYRLNPTVLLHTGYIHTNSSGLLVVRPEPNATVLSGSGAGRTRELELTAKITWRPEQHWIISYVHTRGRGYMNAFDRFLGDFPEPLLRDDVVARLPGIVPHRFLSWGVFPLPYGLQFAPVVEWRNGFPYTILNEHQQYAGTPNAQFLPTFFSLDTRVAKDIAFRGHKVRFSFSVFNVTDHGNYDAIRLNTADPQLGEVLGKRPRRFRLDFDWLF